MPRIHENDGLEFIIYTRDHPPPHVHAFDSDGECIIEIGNAETLPAIREVHGMRNRNVVRAYRIVHAHQVLFLKRWSEIHGS